jgi:hypothetical protein
MVEGSQTGSLFGRIRFMGGKTDYRPGAECSENLFDGGELFNRLSSFNADLQGPIVLNSVLKDNMIKYAENCRQCGVSPDNK